MIAYTDSTVLLRLVLGDPRWLREAAVIQTAISSKLVRVECHVSLDHLWHAGALSDEELRVGRRRVETLLEGIDLRDVDDHVIELATEPLPTSLESLGAIHLATAKLYGAVQWVDRTSILFATHDPLLASAARELHFDVIGT